MDDGAAQYLAASAAAHGKRSMIEPTSPTSPILDVAPHAWVTSTSAGSWLSSDDAAHGSAANEADVESEVSRHPEVII